MENAICNELGARGYSVGVGVVEKRGREEGGDVHKQLEVDFVANRSRLCPRPIGAGDDDSREAPQEKVSLLGINDGFGRAVLVRDMVRFYDEQGAVTIARSTGNSLAGIWEKRRLC